ncbi:MAG: hypothetical protein AAGF94_05085, partial [Pseudomonadota bacterium]
LCSACAIVDPVGVKALRSLSPIATDPAEFTLALDLPDGVGVTAERASLILSAHRDDTGQTAEIQVALRRTTDPEQGELFQIAPENRARFRAAQAKILQWKAEAPNETKGSLSLAIAPCKHDAGPARVAVMSAAIQTERDAPFVPLIADLPVDQISDRVDLENWPQCGTDLPKN